MSTKRIDIREEVYNHHRAHKRGNENFSDTIERLLTEADSDWQTNFGFLDEETGEEFAVVVTTELSDSVNMTSIELLMPSIAKAGSNTNTTM